MEKNWKITTLVIGVVAGALLGGGAAFMLIKRSETSNTVPKVTPNQGIQVGMTVLGLFKQILGLSG
jgi:hypothetical protein